MDAIDTNTTLVRHIGAVPPLWLNVVPLGMEAGDADAAADAKFLAEKTPIDSIAYSMALFPEGRRDGGQ